MGASYENGTWVIEGELPHGITTAQTNSGLIFYSAEGDPQQDCFGLWWEGVGDPEATEECRGCVFNELCLEKMAKARLPEVHRQLKGQADLPTLAQALDVNEQATLAIMAQRQGALPKRPPKKKRKPVVSDETVSAVALGDIGPTTMTDEKEKPQDPCRAPSAKSAVDGAPRKKAPSAKRVKQPGAPRKPWGEHTYLKRFLRERANNKLIGAIPTGTTLQTTYKRQTYQCTCLTNGWEYQCKRFPTLQAVTEEIVGKVDRPMQLRKGKRPKGTRKVCDYSATKLWRLKRVVPELLRQIGCLPESATVDTLRSKTG